ncbi:MAG: flavin reductase family protein [Desulfurococcales archaeon]|nr:flavin reductase family protein [Desulfurococcales archaeon]
MEYIKVEDKHYRLLHPRPAYIVAAGRPGGPSGVMAASWVTPVSEDPPRVAVMWEKDSHTLSIARDTGCFTINIVGSDMLDKLWRVGTVSGWEEPSKAEKAGLRLVESPSGCIRVDGVLGYIDARIYRVLEDVAEDVDIVIGDIVEAYASKDLYNPRRGWNVYKAPIPLQVAGKAFTLPGRIIYPSKK